MKRALKRGDIVHQFPIVFHMDSLDEFVTYYIVPMYSNGVSRNRMLHIVVIE